MPARTDVWIADLAAHGTRLVKAAHARSLLTEAELARAAAISDAPDRERWIAAHAALHLTLQARLGRRVQFGATGSGASGKPRVDGWNGDFSLAHSGNLVVIAIAGHGCVGIDVEVRRSTRMDDSRRRLIETAGAAAITGTPLPADDAEMRFLGAWTRLEAIAKARGTGIGALLDDLGIRTANACDDAVSDATRRLLAADPHPLNIEDIDVRRFDAVAALAASHNAGTAKIRDLSDEPDLFTA